MAPRPTTTSTTTPLIPLGNFLPDYSATNSTGKGKVAAPPGSPYFGRERVLDLITKDVGGTPDSDDDASDIDDDEEGDHEKTTFWQTYIHLLKGYIGCGVLSLPWAVSQLGIPVGIAAIFGMAYWSSYSKCIHRLLSAVCCMLTISLVIHSIVSSRNIPLSRLLDCCQVEAIH
jgi:hypothetical protein